MKCKQIQELMPDLAAGMEMAKPEIEQHLSGCRECAGKLKEFEQTMALLDEWQAPEPSAYFETRLKARVREEAATQRAGWWHWLRRPAMAGALAVVSAVTLTVYHNQVSQKGKGSPMVMATAGTAVGDLEALDKNGDLYANFDELDDLQVQQDVTANP
jgi:anti-sigma factor RsiW